MNVTRGTLWIIVVVNSAIAIEIFAWGVFAEFSNITRLADTFSVFIASSSIHTGAWGFAILTCEFLRTRAFIRVLDNRANSGILA
jgi:hypothetical protein